MNAFLILSAIAQAASPQAAPAVQPAAPAAAAAPSAPTLPGDITGYFTGSWAGSGLFVRSGKPVESTFDFEAAHDGEAILVRHVELAPNSFAYSGVISMDSVSGKPVFLMASNKKGGARLFRSAGWQGDTITFEADPALQAWFARERITFVRKSDRAFKATYEMSRDNGATWRTGDEQDFVKR